MVVYSICGIFFFPILVYGAFINQHYSDPNVVYVKPPSLFSGKWEKIGSTDKFTEYFNTSKIFSDEDLLVEIVAMRHYSARQTDEIRNKEITYKSLVTYQTIDCFKETIKTTKIYLISGSFGNGPIVDEPFESLKSPRPVKLNSIGHSKIKTICEKASNLRNNEANKISSLEYI
jgi:hypothetical protein